MMITSDDYTNDCILMIIVIINDYTSTKYKMIILYD
jgi:hypothetical protein